MSEQRPGTVMEVMAEVRKLEFFLRNAVVHGPDGVVLEDYPIGRTARGRCKLQVEYRKGKGWRTVRTTTNDKGQWCKPRYSTFGGLRVVITHPSLGAQVGWLSFGDGEVWVSLAVGQPIPVAMGPCDSPPRRKETRFRARTTTVRLFGGEPVTGGEEEEQVLPAHPPELCDSWDVWRNEVTAIARRLWALASE